jgi:hypothetical protein
MNETSLVNPRMTRQCLRSGLFVGALASGALLGAARRAGAAPTDDCIAAAEASQALRASGSLLKARERLLSCSRDACPRVVREDCTRWLAGVESETPSLVVLAKDAQGRDVVDLRVTIDDGLVVLPKVDGQPIPLDPGRHIVRYEASGGVETETTVVLGTGEKNRILTLPIAKPTSGAAPPLPAPAPAPPESPTNNPPKTVIRPIPMTTYVLGGVAVASIASLAYFGLQAESEFSRIRSDGCAPRCPPSEVNDGRRDADIADVSLGVAVAAAAATVWIVLARPARNSTAGTTFPFDTSVGFVLLRGGATTGWTGSF